MQGSDSVPPCKWITFKLNYNHFSKAYTSNNHYSSRTRTFPSARLAQCRRVFVYNVFLNENSKSFLCGKLYNSLKISISITLYKELIIKSLVIKFRMCELEGLITGQWHTMQRLYHSAIQPSIQIGFYSITNKHKQRNLWKWYYIMSF